MDAPMHWAKRLSLASLETGPVARNVIGARLADKRLVRLV